MLVFSIREVPMMNLVRYNRQGKIFDLVGSFFNDYMDPVVPVSEKKYVPLVNMYEKDNKFYLEAQLPGIKKEDINIEIDGNYLNLSAESCEENKADNDKYYKKEIIQGKFVRSFKFPEHVDKDKLSAKFENGILKIELPKGEEVKPKQITIS